MLLYWLCENSTMTQGTLGLQIHHGSKGFWTVTQQYCFYIFNFHSVFSFPHCIQSALVCSSLTYHAKGHGCFSVSEIPELPLHLQQSLCTPTHYSISSQRSFLLNSMKPPTLPFSILCFCLVSVLGEYFTCSQHSKPWIQLLQEQLTRHADSGPQISI